MTYKCASCNRTFEKITDEIMCPYCRARILVKARSDIVRKIKVK